MRIALASDNAAVALKALLVEHVRALGHEAIDLGPKTTDSVDYPDYGYRLADAIASGAADRGIALCGSGIGISIAVNRNPAARCALVSEPLSATLCREHNDANVIAIGARQHTFDEAVAFIDRFIATPFSGEERHARRTAQLADFERDGSLLPDPRAVGGGISAPTVGESVDAFDPEAG